MCPDPCPAGVPAATTSIRQALAAFLRDRDERRRFLNYPRVARVVAFLELCIDNHAHRNLDAEERARYEAEYAAGRQFADLFAPRHLLDELAFFVKRFLKEDVVTSEAIENAAEEVVADLKRFLVERGYVSRDDVARAEEAARRRAALRPRTRKAARLVAEAASRLPGRDDERLPCDDHLVLRVEPGRVHLLVFRGNGAEEIGPIEVAPEATSIIEEGWCLCAGLGRAGEKWRLREAHEVYARPELSG